MNSIPWYKTLKISKKKYFPGFSTGTNREHLVYFILLKMFHVFFLLIKNNLQTTLRENHIQMRYDESLN